jgi:hypothetical protein
MPGENYSYSYQAYGLNILSQLPVTGFEEAKPSTADVRIYEGLVPEKLTNAKNDGVLFQSNDHEFLLRLETVAAFYIKNGNEIVIQRLSNASNAEISTFLVGACFGSLMHQRGLLPIHASTLIFKDRSFVFAGNSGAGKTTLAAALINEGAFLVADDISVVELAEGKLCVRPALPVLRLWEDSVLQLGISLLNLEPVRPDLKKYYVPINQYSKVLYPIDHIFILNFHNRSDIKIKKLEGVEKFQSIKKHTYLFKGIAHTVMEKNHFQMVNRLIAEIPVSMLFRPSGVFNAKDIIAAISESFI